MLPFGPIGYLCVYTKQLLGIGRVCKQWQVGGWCLNIISKEWHLHSVVTDLNLLQICTFNYFQNIDHVLGF